MLCLGIETSCDETALGLVRDGKVIGHSLYSQADLHAVYGGVVPEIASRKHLEKIGFLYSQLMEDTSVSPEDIDVVAVARGPGLLGSLLVGLAFAKGLCLATGAALTGVNHLYAHLLAAEIDREIKYPAIGLLVSGGHTNLYHLESPLKITCLGQSIDDAAGEAFDKAAKSLNFPYPGGKYIDLLGQKGEPDKGLFPRPYLDNRNLDFSFSGLKTSVFNYVQKNRELCLESMNDFDLDALAEISRLTELCASFNWSVAETLLLKTRRALDRTEECRSLVVAGGVAANSFVRTKFRNFALERGVDFCVPDPLMCTDNGAMIAYYGWLLAKSGLYHSLEMDAVPRGRKVPWDYKKSSIKN